MSVSTAPTFPAPAYPPTNGTAPYPVPRVGPGRRRSPALVSLGVVLVIVGALGGWRYVASASAATHSYLAVFRPVPVGGQIVAADLQTVSITPARGLTPIPAAQASRVIGEYATVALVPGTLLTDGELATTDVVGPDQALVGLELTSAQRPNRRLQAGDHVLLTEVPEPNGTSGDSTSGTNAQTMPTMPATVKDVGVPDNDGNVVVDVLVPQNDGSLVAYFADQNRVAAVLVAAG
ncbi:MAG TPA: flagellar biosynthesis protein FlgA [Micromonosporaceae bacterium]